MTKANLDMTKVRLDMTKVNLDMTKIRLDMAKGNLDMSKIKFAFQASPTPPSAPSTPPSVTPTAPPTPTLEVPHPSQEASLLSHKVPYPYQGIPYPTPGHDQLDPGLASLNTILVHNFLFLSYFHALLIANLLTSRVSLTNSTSPPWFLPEDDIDTILVVAKKNRITPNSQLTIPFNIECHRTEWLISCGVKDLFTPPKFEDGELVVEVLVADKPASGSKPLTQPSGSSAWRTGLDQYPCSSTMPCWTDSFARSWIITSSMKTMTAAGFTGGTSVCKVLPMCQNHKNSKQEANGIFKGNPSWALDPSMQKLGQSILLKQGDTVYMMSDMMGIN
ncbi:hypothetical protein BDP27DRAFT_1438573 [Rhodocollybia butyracea]|uniref:Uncharacterized protein n=1 Tax=Rhodocollybia butyracea TaxID=206335 RepID=A0A9P5P0B8_9AGAR|nr:hypothetical protein BDP27DRAFT_1438573 [Rhodocollybia butyracea]